MKQLAFAITMLCMIGVAGSVIVVMIYATGGTFGQRCAKAYPGDEAKQLWCVEALASPTPTNPACDLGER